MAEGMTQREIERVIDTRKHPVGITILSVSPPGCIKFTLAKEYFKSAPNFASLPERLRGEIGTWINSGEQTLKILWEDDQSNSIESLSSLCDPKFKIKLESYEDGRSAPKPKGMSWRKLYAEAVARAPYADELRGIQADEDEIVIAYKEGVELLEQGWEMALPQHISTDQSEGTMFKMRETPPPNLTNTFEKVLFHVGLVLPLVSKLE
ncbi:MAG: hypothetical protein SGPRY_001975 [Prymnesium sp.]